MPNLAHLCRLFLWDCVPLLILALSAPEATGFRASSGLADCHYVRLRHFMTAEPSYVVQNTANHVQKICDRLAEGARPGDLEKLFMAVEAEQFSQADMWAKAWAPMRCVIAQVPDTWCVSALIIPRGGKVGWQRHDKADSISTTIFGNLVVTDVELQDSDESRKLEQRELEAAHADAWAIGGSDESDCVCRGGRCPRMWDCPFWVDRRRAEAKGSCAHVASRVPRETSNRNIWKAGRQTVRSLEALEPSTLFEIHVGQRSTRYYKEIPSTLGDVVELIEIMEPLGVKPGVCRYVGPAINLPQ